MGLTIRRGTTKQFMFTIPVLCDSPDGVVDNYDNLPVLFHDEDVGKVYKVNLAYGNYKQKSYFKWTGEEWEYQGSDQTWQDLGSIYVRLTQDSTIIDKEFPHWLEDILVVEFTQNDTIRLSDKKSAKLQVMCVNGTDGTETALKSQSYQVSVLDSLWNEAVHNDEE